MSDRILSSSWSKWARPLLAFVFAAAMIGLSVLLIQPGTWRREIPTDSAPTRELQADERRDIRTDSAQIHERQADERRDIPTDSPRIHKPQADEMTQLTECFAAVRGGGIHRQRLPLRRQPLLHWSDPATGTGENGMWAWGERGRPYALIMMELNSSGRRDDTGSWGFEFVSLVDEPLEVEGSNDVRAMNATSAENSKPVLGGAIHWTPEQSGLIFRDVPDAPAPAQTAEARLAQMKDLIKRFSAGVHAGPGSGGVALMPDPIDRYGDPEAGQVDGAIFAFAVDHNPEVLVLLEYQESPPGKASWRFAVAPATCAPFDVSIDGKQVWTAPYHGDDENKPTEAYFVLGIPRLSH